MDFSHSLFSTLLFIMHTAIYMNINYFNCMSVCMCDKLKLCFNKDSRFSNFSFIRTIEQKKTRRKKNQDM